jgi:hypothetical protein
MCDNLLTADEAYRTTRSNINNLSHNSKELLDILAESIEDKANNGEYKLLINMTLPVDVIGILRDNGYSVIGRNASYCLISSWTISWNR